MNLHRFRAPGTVTNYEMAGLRAEGVHRNRTWRYVWASVSESMHVRSLEEWQEHEDV